MTTPEQLQAWREEFELPKRNKTPMLAIILYERDTDGEYASNYAKYEWQGYLRRCQETEQAIKDSRKQALEEAIAICESFKGGGSNGIQSARVCAYNIKELLK